MDVEGGFKTVQRRNQFELFYSNLAFLSASIGTIRDQLGFIFPLSSGSSHSVFLPPHMSKKIKLRDSLLPVESFPEEFDWAGR